MAKKLFTLTHNGFHGMRVIRFYGDEDDKLGGLAIHVSERVAKRLNDAVCGIADCRCYEHVAYRAYYGDWYVPTYEDGIIKGRYPQK